MFKVPTQEENHVSTKLVYRNRAAGGGIDAAGSLWRRR